MGGAMVFSLEVVDEVFIGVDGFFSDILLGEEVGMGWGVHAVDSFYERGRDPSWEEVDKCVLVGDFAEGDVVFELGDVVSKWEVLCDRGGGEPCNGFIFDIDVDEQCFEVIVEGDQGSKWWGGECKGFLGEGGCPNSGRSSFMKERVKAMFLSSVS